MLAYLVILYFCAVVHATCPNGCGDSASCCEVQPNKFSCCPYTNGVCCADGKHCCPQGSVCDATGLTCKYPIGPQWPLRAMYDPDAKKETGEEVPAEKPPYIVCPDRLSFCSKGNTCCPMSDGRWGCCEHPQGICCSDGGHCCPANTKCNAKDGTCLPLLAQDSNSKEKVNASASLGLFPTGKEEASGRRVNASNRACDTTGEYSCPDDTTCCRENTLGWGCCPLPSAVCCSDGLHCCPKNTVCNIKTGSCTPSLASSSSSLSSSMLDLGSRLTGSDEKKASVHLPTLVNANSTGSEQICADRKTRCSDDSTCCRLADHKSYGCCPLDEGVCCPDGLHCCPKGYTCNLKEGTCVGDALSSSASSPPVAEGDAPTPSENEEEGEKTTTCPGGLVSCPSGTCCPTALGNYRCCAYKSGVCCPDMEHCCPPNSVCNGAGGCLPLGDRTVAGGDRASGGTIATTVITGRGKPVEVVFCPGQGLYCPNATTCCPGSDNSWSCCPYQNAVCCADRSHCCPLGTTCSLTHRGCLPVADTPSPVDQARVRPSTRVSELSEAAPAPSTCPDQETICDDHMPCCQLVEGQWGCCPLANGVCCADANHCCPLGTRCSKDGYCTSTTNQLYTAPYLIPGRRVSSTKREEAFLKGVKPISFHFPLAKTAQPATRDLMLLSASYRRMKEFHHSVCPSGVHRCAEGEQCCPSDRHGYTCAPKTSTCCSSVLDTICPVDKACSSFGMICHPV